VPVLGGTCWLDVILSTMSESRAAPITPKSLVRERCTEIRAGTPPLTTEEAGSLAAGADGEWQVGEGEIRREFTFKTFNAAFGLATRIALLAEAQGHHPELEVGWGRLVVRLSTHSVGGLSRNDFIMAARIDQLAGG
jgi:4a-hydroxytetrahydrobiopterin dehydratase